MADKRTAEASEASTPSLSEAFSKGVAWQVVLKVSSRLISSIQTVVLARMLAPSDFGLMGGAMLVVSSLDTFMTSGYNEALIQLDQETDSYLDTMWIVGVFRGLLLGFVIYLVAPLAGALFHESRIIRVIRVMAMWPIFWGVSSPGLTQLRKDLQFRKLVFFELVRNVLTLVVALCSAFLLRSVWALAVTSLASAALYGVGSFFVHHYRPRLRFEWSKALELWKFGRWLLGSKILHYLFNNGDDWVVGGVLGSTALGFYQTAYRLGSAPMTQITEMISRVAFPTFSQVKEDAGRICRGYERVLKVVMFAGTPVAVGILVVAQDMVDLVLGDEWLPMVASLQVLVIWGWLRSFRATTGPVLNARGRPDLVTRFTLFKVVILAVLIVPMSARWGILGASWSVVISSFLELPFVLRSLRHELQTDYLTLLRGIVRPLLPAGVMALIVFVWRQASILADIEVTRFVSSVVIGAVVYLVTTIFFDKRLHWGLWEDIAQAAEHNFGPLYQKLSVQSKHSCTSDLP